MQAGLLQRLKASEGYDFYRNLPAGGLVDNKETFPSSCRRDCNALSCWETWQLPGDSTTQSTAETDWY
jgi:hypothetical protein